MRQYLPFFYNKSIVWIIGFLFVFSSMSAQNRYRKFMEVTFDKEDILALIEPMPTLPNHTLAGVIFMIDTLPVARNVFTTCLMACRVEWNADDRRAVITDATGVHTAAQMPKMGKNIKEQIVLSESFKGIRNFEFVFFKAATLRSLAEYSGSKGIKLSRIVVDEGKSSTFKYQNLKITPFPEPPLLSDNEAIAYDFGYPCPPVWIPDNNNLTIQLLQSLESYKASKSNIAAINLTIAPNPVASTFQVDVKLDKTEDFMLHIQDMSGKILESHKVDATEVFQKAYNMSALPNGVYLITVKTGSETITRKFLKGD